jgi:hypothetical protein
MRGNNSSNSSGQQQSQQSPRWWFIDRMQRVRGPFTSEQMLISYMQGVSPARGAQRSNI